MSFPPTACTWLATQLVLLQRQFFLLWVSEGVVGERVGPVRVYSNSQIDMVVDRKGTYSRGLLDVELGQPLKGAEPICYDMKCKLEKAKTISRL